VDDVPTAATVLDVEVAEVVEVVEGNMVDGVGTIEVAAVDVGVTGTGDVGSRMLTGGSTTVEVGTADPEVEAVRSADTRPWNSLATNG
jgi:hypothetical protein